MSDALAVHDPGHLMSAEEIGAHCAGCCPDHPHIHNHSRRCAKAVANVTRLEREIRHSHASVVSALENRKAHPSFGYTKTMIFGEFHDLRGELFAWLVVTGAWSAPGRPQLHADMVDIIRQRFSFDVDDLAERVRLA